VQDKLPVAFADYILISVVIRRLSSEFEQIKYLGNPRHGLEGNKSDNTKISESKKRAG